MSFFTRKGNRRSESSDHTGRNLQDGLFQIASQACHILVQVNNTHNVSYGGSNSVKNVAYSKCTAMDGDDPSSVSAPSTVRGTPTSKSYGHYTEDRGKDQDVVVLLPRRKSRTPLLRHKLSTVSENARLDVNSLSGTARTGSGIGGGGGGGDDDLELWEQSGFMLRSDADDPLSNGKWGAQSWCRPSCIPITVILILIVLVVLLPLLDHTTERHGSNGPNGSVGSSCTDFCDLSFVETLPIGMNYSNTTVALSSTYDSWMELISLARQRIEIASFYWTLRREDVYPDDSAAKGEEIFRSLMEAGRDRGIQLKIAQNAPSQTSPNIDTEILASKAKAQVRSLNFAGLLGGGVLHTKMWLIDRTHAYVGSANMDWRSLSQVKELGLLLLNCSCLARDLAKIFDIYWKVAEDGKVPPTWPDSFGTKINVDNPMNFTFLDNRYRTFIASSPPPFSPKGRTNDVDAILHCIRTAERFIYVAVMDYFPLTVFTARIRYWSTIDDALRAAAVERKIHVRLLISSWKHSSKSEMYFLKSLEDLTESYAGVKIEVRRFVVPTGPNYDKIPYSRVNHNKYMVTDTAAYVGTSNWSGDYFTDTAGIGTVFESVGDEARDTNLRQRLENVFLRDWYSEYSFATNHSRSTSNGTGSSAADGSEFAQSSPYVLA